MTLGVAIYVFPNVEVLDFAGPFEVFTTATRVHQRSNPGQPAPFQVSTFARTEQTVTTRAGLQVIPDYTFATCPAPDILVIPGGIVDAELKDQLLLNWVAEKSRSGVLTASVCTGAFIAKAGLLAGRKATTHWEDIADLRAAFPDIAVLENVRWVDEGNIVSSAGIAAGIDMSLHLVSRFAGRVLAEATARQLDVPYISEHA